MLKTAYEKYRKVNLEYGKFLMLTLTSKDYMHYDDFAYEVKKFITNFRYKYKDVEYIRAIECNEAWNHFHCHLIVIFKDKAQTMNRQWLKDHWTHGLVNIRKGLKERPMDSLRYITDFNPDTIQTDKTHLTKFPQFASIIKASNNLPYAEVVDIKKLDKETNSAFLSKCIRDKDTFVSMKKHIHNDKEYIDKVFIQNADVQRILDEIEDEQAIIDNYRNDGENIF